jgi:hypothetical protein
MVAPSIVTRCPNRLNDYLFALCPGQKTFAPMEMSPLQAEGCRVSAFPALRAFEQVGDLYHATTAVP